MSKIASKEELSATVFKFNMALVVEKLKELGCVSAGVLYSGDYDSENTNNTFYTPDVGMPDVSLQSTKKPSLVCQYVQSNFNKETKKWDQVIAERPDNLNSLVSDLCDHCLIACDYFIDVSGNAGYGDEDGGGGVFTIDVQTGAVRLAHYENVVQHKYSNFLINLQTGEASLETPEEYAAAETAPAAPSA